MSPLLPRIDVCVATYKRPQLLRKLLRSLTSQKTEGEFSYRIIVVDNDAHRTAESIVKEFAGNGQKFIYDVEPRQNISLARNRSLGHATGAYIATIDDDEYADVDWLLNLYRTITSYNADVVHGPVIRILPKKTPTCVRQSRVFTAPNLPTGCTDKYTYYTGNSLFRRTLIEQMDIPFDPAFGKTGGGDVLFFENLKRRDCKFIWCSDAKAFEFIPPEKATLLWILQRFFRNGNITYRMHRKPPGGNRGNAWVIFRSCTRLAKALCKVPLYVFASMVNRKYFFIAVKNLERIAFQAGFVAAALDFQYEEYRAKRLTFSNDTE